MAFSPAAPALLTAFLGCATAAMVGGCEKRLSTENIEQVNKLQDKIQGKAQDPADQRKPRWPGISEGMTEKEVESILGQPSVRRTGKPMVIDQPVEIPTVTYVYKQDGQAIELSFLDGKLQGRVPQFGEKMDMQAPLKMSKAAAAPMGGDLSGSSLSAPTHSREFRRVLVEKIKAEATELRAQAGETDVNKEKR